MVSMKALMSLSQYDMGVLDGIAKVKDMLQENNSCNGKSQDLSSSTTTIHRLKWSG